MTVGDIIKYHREKEKLTQSDLAKQIFVSEGAVGHYERGKRTPSMDVLQKIADALKVEIDVFFQEENKRLMQLPYTFIEFKNMFRSCCFESCNREFYLFNFFALLESDRYFVQLNYEYGDSPYTFLIWLLDGFYLVPLEYGFGDLDDELMLDIEYISRVSKADVSYIQNAAGRTFIKVQDEISFAESVYSSKFDTMDFNIGTDNCSPTDLLDFVQYESDCLYAYDYDESIFYGKNNKGIFKIVYEEPEYNEYGSLDLDYYEIEEPVYLSKKELDELKTYTFLKEKEAHLLLENIENELNKSKRKQRIEKHRKTIAFVDKMKRVLNFQPTNSFSFLPTAKEAKEYVRLADKKEFERTGYIDKSEIDTSINNRILIIIENFNLYTAGYYALLSNQKYQVLDYFTSSSTGYKALQEVAETAYEPNAIFLILKDVKEKYQTSHKEYLKSIRTLCPSTKIIVYLLGIYEEFNEPIAKEITDTFKEVGVDFVLQQCIGIKNDDNILNITNQILIEDSKQ